MNIIGWIRDTRFFGNYHDIILHTCYYTPVWYFRKEKMLAREFYNASDPQLAQERRDARNLTHAYM